MRAFFSNAFFVALATIELWWPKVWGRTKWLLDGIGLAKLPDDLSEIFGGKGMSTLGWLLLAIAVVGLYVSNQQFWHDLVGRSSDIASEKERKSGIVITFSRAIFGALKTRIAWVLPIHVITIGIAIVLAGVIWQYMRPQEPRQVVATHLNLGPEQNLDKKSGAVPLPQNQTEARKAEVPPQRPLTPYEAELKLRPIDRSLKILSIEMQDLIEKYPPLQSWWNAIKDPTNNPDFGDRLLAFRDQFKIVCLSLDKLRNDIPEYQDIVRFISQPNYESTLKDIEAYMIMFMYVQNSIKLDAPGDALKAFLDPRMSDFTASMQRWITWRNETKEHLLSLRRQISS
ncbi:hypothetical protein [Tardiphaga sp. 709]|uniref:hypothetical protein n=1 Tax=Tardiphaga sp. 709 TaxID=3076039 RepID=UPI0028E8524A|nr:hypothetical protein [Tardiphaga sp. 709]WNV08901.1 hypothetical protein RSO67_26055 [Tardiphaga sp. 709]